MKLIDAEPLESLLHARAAQCSGSLAGAISGCLKLVQAQPAITQPPNPPLTLEELRWMGGDWVWIELTDPLPRMDSGYYIKKTQFSNEDIFCCGYPHSLVMNLKYSGYGDGWFAYRRKPEEDAHGN